MTSPPHIETDPWERVDEWTEVAFDPPPPGSETPEKLLGVAAPYARREVFDRIREAAE
jgi:hypothetical protein